jgi:dedicator of cytokinesis protein 3
MPWQPLPRIAFAVATHPFQASHPADLPLELGDELYIIEEGGKNGAWLRGYLIAPPSLLAGLTSVKGQTLEARVFSGIFPRSCVEIREVLGDAVEESEHGRLSGQAANGYGNSFLNGLATPPGSRGSVQSVVKLGRDNRTSDPRARIQDGQQGRRTSGTTTPLSIPAKRDPSGVKPPAPVPMLKIGDETPTSASEPLVDEIASCLREWHSTNLHELLLSRKYPTLASLSALVRQLDLARRQLLHNVLTNHELEQLRERTVWDLVRGNKLVLGEVIVRSPEERGRLLTADDSAVEITKLQSMMSLLDERPQPHVENVTLHHLLMEVKTFVGNSSDSTTLVFYLASKAPGAAAKVLSESYIVSVPTNTTMSNLPPMLRMRTLFTDLGPADIGETPFADTELYLVVKIRQTYMVHAGRRSSESRSRSASSSRDDSHGHRENEKPTPSSGGKSARRSLMWGKSDGRRAVNKMQSLPEQTISESRDGTRPNTSASQEKGKGGRHTQTATRTVGIGAIKLNSIMKTQEDFEQGVSIWSPSQRPEQDKFPYGDGWEEVIRDLLDNHTGNFDMWGKPERLILQLRPFAAPDADAIVKSTPTRLSEITQTNKMGFSGAPTKPRSDIYVTLDKAYLTRHTLLSRSSGNPSALPSHLLPTSNLQVTLEVRTSHGDRIEGAIYTSSNSDPVGTWESTATLSSQAWNENLRLSIPAAAVPGSHLVMTLADAPNAPFAMSYLPLWDEGAFMHDGRHSCLLYKYDEATVGPHPNSAGKGGYLHLRWEAAGSEDAAKSESAAGPLARLRVQTYLCSTKFSQDKVLLGLLNWKRQSRSEVQELLRRLVFVPEIEIVKLLNDVFDAIFGILAEYSGNDAHEDLVFSALVTVLGIVHDRRFNLGPLVDQYAESSFRHSSATSCLVRSFNRLLSNPADPDAARRLRATFKVVRHILKFIANGRDQQKATEAGIGIAPASTSPGFSRHLRSIFKALDALMRNNTPSLVGSQTLAVQHFHTWLPELSGLLTTEEILHVAVDFLDACKGVRGKLVLYKLILIINYSKLELFSKAVQRAALAANTVRWIAPHWGKTREVNEQYRDQVRLCCSVLASQMDMLGPEVPNHVSKIVDSYLAILRSSAAKEPQTRLSLLFPTSYPFPSKPIAHHRGTHEHEFFSEPLLELSAILSAISTSPTGLQLELAASSSSSSGNDDDEDPLATLIQDVLAVHLSLLNNAAFPPSWLTTHIHTHRTTLTTLQSLAPLLLNHYLPPPSDAGLQAYNTPLWRTFFSTLLALLRSPALALETFPEQKRRAVWKVAGDVREEGAELLSSMWDASGWETSAEEKRRFRGEVPLKRLGGWQVQYVPGLVGPVTELGLSVHEGLRRTAVGILRTMCASEWSLSEDLGVIREEMIESLDRLFKEKKGVGLVVGESMVQKLFVSELMELFEPLAKIQDDPLYEAVRELVGTIDEFLDLLVAVHGVDGGSSSANEASHLMHRLRLMEFLRDMQKEDIFIHYVHQLSQLQAEAGNFTEAGLALRLHADLYDWDPVKMLPSMSGGEVEYPAQSQFERKERVYFAMISHFEAGEAWGPALAAYQELATQYSENVFDFSKLARTQRAMASVYETVTNKNESNSRVVPKYFKVTFKGLGFPVSLRGREFVYEGAKGGEEKLTGFVDRLQEMWPSATIVTSSSHGEAHGHSKQSSNATNVTRKTDKQSNPDDDPVEGQHLLVTPLSPHRPLDHHVFQRAKVSHVVREYLLTSHAQRFAVTTRRVTGAQNVREHWAEKLIYTTQESFPTILRRSEAVKVERVRLGSLEAGLERIVRKTQEMAAVERKVSAGESEDVEEMAKLLVEAVHVSVNPGSESSVAKYRELLPTSKKSGVIDNLESDEEVEEEDDDDAEEVQLSPPEEAIRIALLDHAIMIKGTLAMFAKSSRALLQSSHPELSHNFEISFAPELAILSPARARAASQHLSSSSQPWSLPGISAQRESQRAVAPVSLSPRRSPKRQSYAPNQNQNHNNRNSMLTASATNATMRTADTSILDTPTRPAKNPHNGRLSFLSRSKLDAQLPALPVDRFPSPPATNHHHGHGYERSHGHQRNRTLESATTTGMGRTSADVDVGSGGRRERNLFTSSGINAVSAGIMGRSASPGGTYGNASRDRLGSVDREDSGNDWVTDSGAGFDEYERERSASVATESTGGGGTLGRGVGSVRKRLSMLKLGRKGSRIGVGAGEALVEE